MASFKKKYLLTNPSQTYGPKKSLPQHKIQNIARLQISVKKVPKYMEESKLIEIKKIRILKNNSQFIIPSGFEMNLPKIVDMKKSTESPIRQIHSLKAPPS
jgi:hypothetical protein